MASTVKEEDVCDLLVLQAQDKEVLAKLLTNWKKTGLKKRSKKSFITKREKVLGELWTNIKERHLRIVAEVELSGVDYMANDEFGQMQRIHDEMLELIKKGTEALPVVADHDTSSDEDEPTSRSTQAIEAARKNRTLAFNVAKEYIRVYSEEAVSKEEAIKVLSEIKYRVMRLESTHDEFMQFADEEQQVLLTNEFLQLRITGRALISRLSAAAECNEEEASDEYSESRSSPQVAGGDRKQQQPQAEAGRKGPMTNENSLSEMLAKFIGEITKMKSGSEKYSDVRLPKIVLSTFDGAATSNKWEKWIEFHDMFTSLVHNKTLDNIVKMTMLKNHLAGEAAAVIAHYSITANNYDSAWRDVCERYNDEKAMVMHLLKKLFSLSAVSRESSLELKLLLDSFKSILHFLQNLKQPVKEWNSILVFALVQRMPGESLIAWEQSCKNAKMIPQLIELEMFLEKRIRALETVEIREEPSTSGQSNKDVPPKRPALPTSTPLSSIKQEMCRVCKKSHKTYNCSSFSKMSLLERQNFLNQNKLCHVCLEAHATIDCSSQYRCRRLNCGRRHHILLHVDEARAPVNHHNYRGPPYTANNYQTVQKEHQAPGGANAVLPTAWITIKDQQQNSFTFRALIDQGSQRSYVSEKLVQTVRMSRERDETVTCGLGGRKQQVNGAVNVLFSSIVNPSRNFSTRALVLPYLTTTPAFGEDESFKTLKLADPEYFEKGPIDIILGGDVFKAIIINKLKKGTLLAQKTYLGWILSGVPMNRVQDRGGVSSCFTVVSTDESLDQLVRRFWETEEKVVERGELNDEEAECERIYKVTTRRAEDGSYICSLPLKPDCTLGRSRHIAAANLKQLQKRFSKNPEFEAAYKCAIEDYIDAGHAVRVTVPESQFMVRAGRDVAYACYYMPHLAVFKQTSTTTKTRIVFNASCKTSNKRSLNDNLMVGPVIQPDLVDKITRFRMWKYVAVCDITKMYRQIRMSEAHWPYQRFLWPNEKGEIEEFSLTRVTFGQSSAPFTAIRTLLQIAEDHSAMFPIAAKILEDNSYVDDLHYGDDATNAVREGINQLIQCLGGAGMNVRQWASNDPTILGDMTEDLREMMDPQWFMGVKWCRAKDTLSYPCLDYVVDKSMSKRMLLSQISRVYDPMGWIQPIVFSAKVLMQNTWIIKLLWESVIPSHLFEMWQSIVESLQRINEIEVPRWIGIRPDTAIELHGFADASKLGYGCVIYLRVVDNESIPPAIVVSKSRVAPIDPVTIPRLELKGALLLADMMKKVQSCFGIPTSLYGWLDSKVALCWISDPNTKRWNVYVRNRVAAIHQLCPDMKWNYVSTADNPADLVSRGCTIDVLKASNWMTGPRWLQNWKEADHRDSVSEQTEEELAKPKKDLSMTLCNVTTNPHQNWYIDLVYRYSSYNKVVRVLARIRRCLTIFKGKMDVPMEEELSVDEIDNAETELHHKLQGVYFADEVKCLRDRKALPKSSKLLELDPFLDDRGLLRVGGRLRNASLPFDAKHPSILPVEGPLTHMMVTMYHVKCMHGGPTMTLSFLRQKFWIIGGMRKVKAILRQCGRCCRIAPRLCQQKMGQLPRPRVELSKAFLHTGVDFAGPFMIKWNTGRGNKSFKAYVAVFVCLAVKALHFELVSDLTSDSFIAALKRFVGRRGPVTNLYSDNGTNFVGAIRQLDGIMSRIGEIGVKWDFIPPSAPHFGGLWEAGVKSLKTHLKKVMSNVLYTWEEMTTMLCEIEGCLNARPLCPLVDDIDNVDVLTPNHFINGTQYAPVPELSASNLALRTRWEMCCRQYQEVVQRYKWEYLSRLQSTATWQKERKNVAMGAMVLVKDDCAPSHEWPLGRVIKIHPGSDGLVRVVTVRTRKGEITRPIAKVAPLP